MKLHPRTMHVQGAAAVICTALINLQHEYGLTDVEMLKVINEWQALHVKYMLREERHPDDPERGGDEE